MNRTKVLTVFGTRPEAIKMAPVVLELNRRDGIEHKCCITAQHREMVDQMLAVFDLKPDYDLNIFEAGQTLSQVTTRALEGLEGIIKDFKPDLILVQGDTTTVFVGALAAFYNGVKVGHVEAGLRSGDLYSPYPEEANRKLTGVVTNYHFAPTETSKNNLLSEGYDESTIFVTGNTAIDALNLVARDEYVFKNEILNEIDFENNRVIYMTAHRRENLGEPMHNIFSAMRRIVEEHDDVVLVFPMHLNPKVREVARKYLSDSNRIYLLEPIDYNDSANIQKKAYMVATDSGGIQEESPNFGKPVLVLRKETERPEGIEAGTAKLAGVDADRVYALVKELLTDEESYDAMANAVNPYGDGHSAEMIVDIIESQMGTRDL
ncbi:MAG: UDP-N-acetylglucosamine 2-epimerase (non-hydrolyzing) [Tissierellales bacterium]|jgi:UDP-N-acetylglucosamine 2-epimerase (non-hydrolysing)|nr:UDP-N-acetylglucosamine 2-epimerase (non-hydrolyzing) [Tissierellales bacterium]